MVTCNILEKIIKKYKLMEKTYIDMNLIDTICTKDKIYLRDLQYMLQISDSTMSKLKNGHQMTTKLNFNKCNEIKNDLISKKELNYTEFVTLKDKLSVKDYRLLHMLGITIYRYKKMKNDINYKVTIKDTNVAHTVNLIKIDLKYQTKTSQYIGLYLD